MHTKEPKTLFMLIHEKGTITPFLACDFNDDLSIVKSSSGMIMQAIEGKKTFYSTQDCAYLGLNN
ncbi:hypothetical protein [Vibrio hepatarius]|uniref:hypothetical protein n=1 Tax=Vibrio hepatarius TaxID=171383 RepID=UPI001C0A512F|nr:hypothetical protein [Vibrio hepatarius]MBU2895699.1 hypothetical protein [Vibrio hepatarius]